jgi:hypothetical protein
VSPCGKPKCKKIAKPLLIYVYIVQSWHYPFRIHKTKFFPYTTFYSIC